MKYQKGDETELSPYFAACEFDCPCKSCSGTLIDPLLIAKLSALRDELGVPIHVLSGYRCENHQKELTAKGLKTAVGVSQHELGRAADVKTGKHMGSEIAIAARKVGFKAVGVALQWVHVDLRGDKERRWTY